MSNRNPEKICNPKSIALVNEICTIYSHPFKKPINAAKEYPKLYLRARKVFGSWRKALEACGINYEESRNRKKWSREKVLKEIRNLHESGQSLRPCNLRGNGMISLRSAATYHFGSWRKAVETCGVCYSCSRVKKKRGEGSPLADK
ncbi:MAG TPA: hypothetical protein VLB01_03855 [Thermodesulfobacteriota bacterium]|nr:hypothetical protein [Thermodesulfobacteriota bacterium]